MRKRTAAKELAAVSIDAKGFIRIEFPENADFNINLVTELNRELQAINKKQSLVLGCFNGVQSFSYEAKSLLSLPEHSNWIKAMAFVSKSNGDMKVLEEHYIQQYFEHTRHNHYIKQFFSDEKAAINWLSLQS